MDNKTIDTPVTLFKTETCSRDSAESGVGELTPAFWWCIFIETAELVNLLSVRVTCQRWAKIEVGVGIVCKKWQLCGWVLLVFNRSKMNFERKNSQGCVILVTRTNLQRHSGLAYLEIGSGNEEAINFTRNMIYSLKVFYFLLYGSRHFLFVSELI